MPQTGYPCGPAIKAFFVKIDEPVHIRHEVLEFQSAGRVCLGSCARATVGRQGET
jgi:hypothetical protein